MEEIWKEVEGYEGVLEISNLGNGRTLNRDFNGIGFCGSKTTQTTKGQPCRRNIKRNGYVQFAVRAFGIRKWFLVHRLVALVFIPNPNNYGFINHKDGNKENNHYSNLEWTTSKRNMIHAHENGLCRIMEKHYKVKLNKDQVREILESNLSQKNLASKYGVSRSTIYAIKRGKTWKYINNPEAEFKGKIK